MPLRALLAIASWALLSCATFAQEAPSEPGSAPDSATGSASEPGLRNGSFVLAPVPFHNPALDSGLALGGAYLFESDAESDTSAVGAGGFRSLNGSRGLAAGFNLNLDSNRWKTTFLLGDLDLNYDLFVGGVPVPLNQSARGVSAKVLYGVAPDLWFGAALAYAKSTIQGDGGAILPPSLTPDIDLELLKASLNGEFDRRDDSFYPTSGLLASGDLSFGAIPDGIFHGYGRNYVKGVAKISRYSTVFGDGVFAWQAVGCAVSDEAPFFDACALGGTDSLRGFSPTEFLDDALFSAQAEYRGRINRRFGYVAFVGAGSVDDDFVNALTSDYMVAGGIGARIRLSSQFPLDYAVDVSLNQMGERILYISVGQNF